MKRPRLVRMGGVAAAALLALVVSALAITQAGAAGSAAAGGVNPAHGFPRWYQDARGDRVEPCLDANDPNCVVLGGPTFDTTRPLAFPGNFPDEFFYALADSDVVSTPGCGGTAPGKASVRLALEGAFMNGDPAPNEQIVFGRIRVRVSSGLCPNTTYRFRHPFGTETITTDDAGAVPANKGTEDIGCVGLAPPATCDFATALRSRVLGSVSGGFLRWDPDVAPAAPQGYLGDGATPHRITGGTDDNAFEILDANGNALQSPLQTDLFTVAGKLAGSLQASPDPADFGGQAVGTTSALKQVTVTNVDSSPVTVSGIDISGPNAAQYTPDGACVGTTLNRDETCKVGVRFTPSQAGRQPATLAVSSTGGVRSPVRVALTGSGIQQGDAPDVSLSPASLDFAGVRVRTISPTRTVTVTNSGTAPLQVQDVRLVGDNAAISQYRIASDGCANGSSVDPGASCAIGVQFLPMLAGDHPVSLEITSNSNGSPDHVAVTGTGTGGVAAVSSALDPGDHFPQWYRDEAGVKLAQCIDPSDPNCIVLADAFFDPAKPLQFPTNFPEEFFYTVADSDIVTTPGCDGSAPGKAFMRSAVEGAFTGAGPIDGDQMTFGRLRIAVTGGLCPLTEYAFTTPYGLVRLTTNERGGIARSRGTEDVGCAPVAPDTCDFSMALSSRIVAGFLRWDPKVAPAAPAGYIGDAATLHKVVGAPFSPDGTTPANYFAIAGPDGKPVGRTDLFTVMGKLRGPLEATPGSLDLGVVTVGTDSGQQDLTYENTGLEPVSITGASVAGTDAADFTVGGGTCVGATLAPGDTCTVPVSFRPAATGVRRAKVVLRHTGLNDPLEVPVSGTGGAVGQNAAISFEPRSVEFAPLHVGRTSPAQTVRISNAGGGQPLDVRSVTVAGTDAASFKVTANRCGQVAPGDACEVDVAMTPAAGRALSASLVVTDNAPNGPHRLALSGTGSSAVAAVAPNRDSRNGFPQYYQDANGVRLEPCLDPADANCIVLSDAFFDPTLPVSFADNFPGEFFYAVADSDVVTTPGCPGAGIAEGTASLRVALEGSFLNGRPAAGDQITFGRVRILVKGGLCPNTPYRFDTPYGTVPLTTNASGGVTANAGTTDLGCAPAAGQACDFGVALGSPSAGSFLRWAPGVGAAAPAGYLGDARTLHRVVGGTDGNAFSITDSAGNPVGGTELFTVSGKVAGPLLADARDLDLGHVRVGLTSGAQTVTITNAGAGPVTLSGVDVTGTDAAAFKLGAAGTCAAAKTLAVDGSCTVRVTFSPATAGTKAATLRVTTASGASVLVGLQGVGDPAGDPVASVSPGVLAYGTVNAGSSASLTTTVTNTGKAALRLTSAPALSGPAAADYKVTNGCTVDVQPNKSCTITVTFAPTATGARTATLTLSHNTVAGQTQVSLTGTGAAASFSVSPSSVTFGGISVNSTKSSSVTIKNSGTIAGTVQAAAITDDAAGVFRVAAVPAACVNLAPGRTCSLTVSYAPRTRVTSTANLVVTGDGRTLPSTVKAPLSGTGK